MSPLRQRRGTPPDPLLPVYRRRLGWYLQRTDARTRALLRLLPALLASRFRRPGFDREPPGLLHLTRRRRWGALCQAVELPLPQGWAFARPMVRSVLYVPLGERAGELLLFATDEVKPGEQARLLERVEALRLLFQKVAPHIEVRFADAAQLTPSMMAWAAVVAGDMPPASEGPLDLLDLVQRAPSALARAVALLVPPDAPSLIDAARLDPTLRSGPPEVIAARWSRDPIAQQAVVVALHPAPSLASVVEVGRTLQARALVTWRALPHGVRRGLGPLLRQELLGSRVPLAMRGTLERALGATRVSEHADDGLWSLRADGVELASARTVDEARARAYAVSPRLVEHAPEWRRVAAMGSTPRRALVVVEPKDSPCLLICTSSSGRPRARRVDRTTLARRALWLRSRGDLLEVLLHPQADQGLATRLNQVSALPSGQHTLGVQVGERLVLAQGAHTWSRPLASYLAWPRLLRWLPEQAEWLSALKPPMASPIPNVHASVWPGDRENAVILYVDKAGRVLREEAELIHLEDHLKEAREVLREGPAPAVLSVTVHPRLAMLGGRRLNADLPVAELDVDWSGPGHVRLRLEGERFMGPADPPLSAAVETIFSRWPLGVIGRVGVRRVRFLKTFPDTSPLQVLAVRAHVLRRVAAGVRRFTWLLEAA